MGGVPAGRLMAHPTVAVLERRLILYRRLWQASVFSSFVLPLLFVMSIGIGVGGYVGEVEGTDYLSWIVPGVLASTAFQMAVGECTYTILGDFTWVRAFPAMYSTPVRVRDMVSGWLLYMLFRVQTVVVSFLVITSLFGAVHSPWALAALPVCALLTVAVAAPTTAFAASVDHDSYFAVLFRLVMIPSALFAGVFFPVWRLPELVRPMAYASPLWHAVALCRAATLGTVPPWPFWLHVGYLLIWAVLGCVWALYAFRRRLRD
jgi:Nod factor-specific ABC transporter NodJ protein